MQALHSGTASGSQAAQPCHRPSVAAARLHRSWRGFARGSRSWRWAAGHGRWQSAAGLVRASCRGARRPLAPTHKHARLSFCRYRLKEKEGDSGPHAGLSIDTTTTRSLRTTGSSSSTGPRPRLGEPSGEYACTRMPFARHTCTSSVRGRYGCTSN